MKKEKKVKEEFRQQGDVLFFSVASIPEGTKPATGRIRDGRVVLAEGEATGHAHTVEAPDVEIRQDEKGTLWLSVKKDEAVVQHQEHGPVTLPKGDYRVGNVVEYDPFADALRKVRD